MKLTIEIPDTIRKDEAVLKKDLLKFIDESIHYFQKEMTSEVSRRDEAYKNRLQGAISTYKVIERWIRDYEL